MKFNTEMVERIVREEVQSHLRDLVEAGDVSLDDAESDTSDKEKKGKEKPKLGRTPDIVKNKPADKKGPKDPGPKPADKADTTKPDEQRPKGQAKDAPKELPTQDEPEDAEIEKDVDDGERDGSKKPGGKISSEVTGKTVQSITMSPKSKILPGAQEIELQFKEMSDPLKIMITKTGAVKFFFRGALHDML
jgi:hypothetical protein